MQFASFSSNWLQNCLNAELYDELIELNEIPKDYQNEVEINLIKFVKNEVFMFKMLPCQTLKVQPQHHFSFQNLEDGTQVWVKDSEGFDP